MYVYNTVDTSGPRSKAWICGRSFAGIVVSNPNGAWTYVSCECRVLPDKGVCDGPITRPEESHRL